MYRVKSNNKPRVKDLNKYILKNSRTYKTIDIFKIPAVKSNMVENFLTILPPEILNYICEYLDNKSITIMSGTCTKLRYLKPFVLHSYIYFGGWRLFDLSSPPIYGLVSY